MSPVPSSADLSVAKPLGQVGESSRRILSIDGGGIMGTFPAAFLAAYEEDLGRPIGAFFDLIAGTSTGGILAIGLALGIPAKRDHLKLCALNHGIWNGTRTSTTRRGQACRLDRSGA
jgi:hypothetical protein